MLELPDSYTNVPPVKLHMEQPKITVINYPTGNIKSPTDNSDLDWLDSVRQATYCNGPIGTTHPQTDTAWLSWSAYHASNASSHVAVLPLFEESSNSVSMIKHSIDVVIEAIQFLNPGQIPVITMEQPLYAIAKTIQWNWPSVYGENRLVIVMGGLHIEIAALKTFGASLKDSGW